MFEWDLGEGSLEPPDEGTRIIHTRVVGNSDQAGLGRVWVDIPWLDGPVVADVATLMSGRNRGTFFIPQENDEVLALITKEPDSKVYVIGSLWTDQDTPPLREPDAAANVQLIRTPGGHEIKFDGRSGELVISTEGGQKVSLAKDKVEIRSSKESSAAVITLNASGNIELKGNSVTVEAKATLTLKGNSVEVDAQSINRIKGGTVTINT